MLLISLHACLITRLYAQNYDRIAASSVCKAKVDLYIALFCWDGIYMTLVDDPCQSEELSRHTIRPSVYKIPHGPRRRPAQWRTL